MFDSNYLDPPATLRLRSGEAYDIEEAADLLLAQGRKGVTALRDKRDYLTTDQLKNRAQKEVLNHTGICDESLMSGLFRRSYNPLAGSRPSRRMHTGDE